MTWGIEPVGYRAAVERAYTKEVLVAPEAIVDAEWAEHRMPPAFEAFGLTPEE